MVLAASDNYFRASWSSYGYSRYNVRKIINDIDRPCNSRMFDLKHLQSGPAAVLGYSELYVQCETLLNQKHAGESGIYQTEKKFEVAAFASNGQAPEDLFPEKLT